MEITEVRVRKYPGNGKLKAFVSVTFDDCFVVHDIKVIEGNKGLFVAMPSRKLPDGSHRDVAHPIHSTMRNEIEGAILAEFEQTAAEEGASGTAAQQQQPPEERPAPEPSASEAPEPEPPASEAPEPSASEPPEPSASEPHEPSASEAHEPEPPAPEPKAPGLEPTYKAPVPDHQIDESDDSFGTPLSSASGKPPSLDY